MSRVLSGRRGVIAAFIAVSALGTLINGMGPFAARPSIPYPEFVADLQAGRVDQIVQWRNRLEVTEGSRLVLVTVPAGADLWADLAAAEATAGGSNPSRAGVPDAWLVAFTPWIPLLLLVAGLVIWLRALLVARPGRRSLPPEPALP